MEELTFKQPSMADRRFALLLVLAQVILLAVISALPGRTHWPVPAALRRAGYLGIAAGGCLAAVGAASLDRGLTALPLPNDRAQLRTGGLYRWVRHPIYSGLLIGAAARAAISGNRWALVSFMALAGLLTGKAQFEERHLTARFPGYAEYAAHSAVPSKTSTGRQALTPAAAPSLNRQRGGAAAKDKGRSTAGPKRVRVLVTGRGSNSSSTPILIGGCGRVLPPASLTCTNRSQVRTTCARRYGRVRSAQRCTRGGLHRPSRSWTDSAAADLALASRARGARRSANPGHRTQLPAVR